MEDGLNEGGDNLSFTRVFERLEEREGVRVTHASVLGRIWANQKDFQRDVLVELARAHRNAYVDTVDAMAPVLAAVDLSSLEGRWAGARELGRIGCQLVLDANTSSPVWRAWMSVWALGPSASARGDDGVAEALVEGYQRVNQASTEMHAAMAGFLGFRPKPPMTIERYTTVVTALTEGCSVRDLLGAEGSRGIVRPTGPGGEPREWTLYGLALVALFADFFESRGHPRVPRGEGDRAGSIGRDHGRATGDSDVQLRRGAAGEPRRLRLLRPFPTARGQRRHPGGAPRAGGRALRLR
jgi:hypothetical protein